MSKMDNLETILKKKKKGARPGEGRGEAGLVNDCWLNLSDRFSTKCHFMAPLNH